MSDGGSSGNIITDAVGELGTAAKQVGSQAVQSIASLPQDSLNTMLEQLLGTPSDPKTGAADKSGGVDNLEKNQASTDDPSQDAAAKQALAMKQQEARKEDLIKKQTKDAFSAETKT